MPANRRLMVLLLGVAFAMVGASFAAVPAYNAFCRLTGFGGTPQRADAAPAAPTGDGPVVTVRFNADVDPELAWTFETPDAPVHLRLGESRLVAYRVRNTSDHTLIGTAAFNVAPAKAGLYFNKVQCFCFSEQRLEPGQEAEMPVVFFVDPAIADDNRTYDVTTITLSYTFFLAEDLGPPDGQPSPADVARVRTTDQATVAITN
ncbi:MAG: cytochrome c oxidase assembly protein [Alphaproteobacteria bacterium]